MAEEWKEANEESARLVEEALLVRKRKLCDVIEADTQKIESKRQRWDAPTIEDMEEQLTQKKERLSNIEGLLSPGESKGNRQKLNQMKRRRATKLFQEKRVKQRRKTNQGNRALIDSDDEEFIAKCIEDKATYHGRRQDTVMYLNRRVKKSDLLNIANKRLWDKEKKLIKSATTVYNRCKPRSSRSIQARRHKGKGLFCTKKPPKAEDIDNENTHYQRAHVKNIKQSFFGRKAAETSSSKYCFMRSIDDKAYLRPGTSEGFAGARNQSILTMTDVEKARKLPKYDWPEKLVYQTPGAHRVFAKAPATANEGDEKLVTTDDNHFVFVRPKALVNSSGSTWASETVRLRQRNPELFEVKGTSQTDYSEPFRQACAIAENACFLYKDMTEEDDVKRVSAEEDCTYRKYESERLSNLWKELKSAHLLENNFPKAGENEIFKTNVLEKLETLMRDIDQSLTFGQQMDTEQMKNGVRKVASCCNSIISVVRELKLPLVKPKWCDLTDAGPGVGISNFEVKFRDAELCRIYQSDYRIRVHRSRGDSGQGEAERTNSAIGDSVVDGATINWEKVKQFEGMSEDEIKNLGVKEFEEMETVRMEKNAWYVAELLVERIDGAPVFSERIKAWLSEKNEHHFFFNREYLLQFHKATTQQAKDSVPGAAYFNKIVKFYDKHYRSGELFMEFLKFDCQDPQCEHCGAWTGVPTERVPQPVPDREHPGHYMDVANTPKQNDKGEERSVDDWQPRANITKLFESGDLNLEDETKIAEFGERFCVKMEYVRDSIQHLTNLKFAREIRAKKRATDRDLRKERTVHDYDWIDLVMNGKLKGLTVDELNKYLNEHGLSKQGKKADKIAAITTDVLRKTHDDVISRAVMSGNEQDASDSEDDSDNDEDLVLEEFGDSETSSDEDPEDQDDDDCLPLVVRTRYGRASGNWNLFQLH